MNEVGLCAYYQVSTQEEAESLLEDELFALKQHFIDKPWLTQTAKSRLKKMDELAVYFVKEQSSLQLPVLNPTDNVADWWRNYQHLVLWGKQQIMLQSNPLQLKGLIDDLFRAVRYLFSQVPQLHYTSTEPIFGTDPDPMLVQKEIVALNSRGISTFAQISEQREAISDVMLVVCKRWSLMVNYL